MVATRILQRAQCMTHRSRDSLQDGSQLGEHFVHDSRRHAFQLPTASGTNVEGAWLTTAHHARGARPCPHE